MRRAGWIGWAARRRSSWSAVALMLAFAALAALTLWALGAGPWRTSVTPAYALAPFGGPEPTTPQVDGGVPAHLVTMIGATPEEPGAPGADEAWGIGKLAGSPALVRYTRNTGEEGGWTLGPALPKGFKPSTGPLAGTMTPQGYGALLGTTTAGSGETRQAVLARKPDGAFEETALVPEEGKTGAGEEPLLHKGEELFTAGRAPVLAALEEGGQAGLLLAPLRAADESAVEDQVLHWDGHSWSSEPIEVPAASKEAFRVLAIGASSPGNAWLLAQLSSNPVYPSGSVALFRREQEGGKWSWRPVALEGKAEDGEAHPLTVPLEKGEAAPFSVAGIGEPPSVKGQLLTVTSQGVWVDGERHDVTNLEAASTTIFVQPSGATASATVKSSWCQQQSEATQCLHGLPEPLPLGTTYSRSFAWANGGKPYGERVITGLREGLSLRLEGESFVTVQALGGGHSEAEDPGAEYGAAFASPTEGWLGQSLLPVHLTTEPVASRLTPWPVPFRTPLYAVAPEPGQPVGSLKSEALAVGLEGAVARYKPGVGWLPESLFGPGEKVEKPQLRAVAWPTPTRAYAVGNKSEMWLWREEIGLWEKDPATPQNLRANLLGIAFDPEDPSRGYAVGSDEVGVGGVLLRYGKTWTEETSLPAQVQGAVFTSIAFAGSEAIVAYRKQPNPSSSTFVGGLLVNKGSGWEVDQAAEQAFGAENVPRSVAGLPDGGAAVITEGPANRVFERQSATSPWQETTVPPPGTGSYLALFREGGVLRALVAGGGAGDLNVEPGAPAGFPPNIYGPVGELGVGPETAVLLRQTASGWSDQTHELDPVKQPEGGYAPYWDEPYRPDPVEAVLISPSGGEGWAVGGDIGQAEDVRTQTSDIERYPAEGFEAAQRKLSGEVSSAEQQKETQLLAEDETLKQVPLAGGDVTIAVGAHAECSNPCANRARAGVGPQVWLSSALALARSVKVKGFYYLGPSVTEGKIGGLERSLPLPFTDEFERTASILAEGQGEMAVHVLASPQDRDARPYSQGNETLFQDSGLKNFLGSAGSSTPHCEGGEECASAYALTEQASATGLGVRVIALDESATVGANQRAWLQSELQAAKSARTPAIVLGSSSLNAEIASGEQWAVQVAEILEAGEASAYLFDSPEEDVTEKLHTGHEGVPAYGTGTLGYEQAIREAKGDFHGASGIILAQVEVSRRTAASNRVPVRARLIPVIGELALEAKSGVLLKRSSPALFEGLARRPRAGTLAQINEDESLTDPYIPIPEECIGRECSVGLHPEYTFTSSEKDIGEFVKRNTAAANNPYAVLQNAKGEPESSEPGPGELPGEQSGLFCAFNPGETTVTISAGDMSASLRVRVQAGSVREPCGTVKLTNPPAASTTPVETPPPESAGESPTPASTPPPVPLPPAPPVVVPTPPKAALPPFVPLALPSAPVLAFVPPPVPTPARPSPPSGTSAVTSPIEVAEHEDEEEEATEQASNNAVAYRSAEQEPTPLYVLGIIVLGAFAGATARRRPRRGRRQVRVAPATVTTARRQRELERRSRRGWR